MPCSLFLDAGNQIQHNPQNSPSFFADLCICYFWISGIFWKSQNCWRRFNHSFSKRFLHHHDIYAVYLSHSKPKSQGGVSKHWRNPRFCREGPAKPIQGGAEQWLNKFCQLDTIPAWSSASWAWQELVAVPQTISIWGSEQQCPSLVGNGVLIIHPCSQVRSQQFFFGLLLGWVSCGKSPGITSTDKPLFFNYWEARSNRNPSWCCRKQEWGNIGGGNIGVEILGVEILGTHKN